MLFHFNELVQRLIAIVFGLIVGSFLNVVIHRLPLGQSVVRPRSRCTACEAPISAWQNIPVLSFILLGGRCSKCKTAISVRYPVVELMTAFLFLAAVVKYGLGPATILRDWVFLAILVATTFIDLDHRLIPDQLSLGGLVWGLLTCWMVPSPGWILSLTGALFGFSLFYGLAWTYLKFTQRSGLGGGDIKLLAMLGAYLGPAGVLVTVMISSLLGSIIGVGWALWARSRETAQAGGVKNERLLAVAIPYGPFLVLGALVHFFFGEDLISRFWVAP